MHNILLVEDDQNLGFLVEDQLKSSGFRVFWASDGEKGKKEYLKNSPDLCLLDVMLPKKDGFELAKYIRERDQETPILFITAKDLKEDVLNGFHSGGDDYIIKPFSMEELLQRIRVFLRRSGKSFSEPEFDRYSFKSLQIDFKKNSLETDTKQKPLTEKEKQLFKLLIQNRDRILKREEILLKIWGDDDYFMGRSLDVFISRLRKYLKDSPVQIKNYHGIGFKWEEM